MFITDSMFDVYIINSVALNPRMYTCTHVIDYLINEKFDDIDPDKHS